MDGVIVIDKPSGWTSHDVVAKIRNITRIRKVGHTGTLDPFATGVLPLTLGKATKLTNHFLSSDKRYHGAMRFGFATTTYDLEGESLGDDVNPELDRGRLEELFCRYVGDIQQTLPPYSAKKVRGKPMYAYARKGIDLGISQKRVTIKSLTLRGIEGNYVEFEMVCAAGTYARSLAHDIGREYGCGAHLVRLQRTRSGEFALEAAVPLGDGDNFHSKEFFLSKIIPMRELLQDIPAILVSEGDKVRAIHGMDLNLLTGVCDANEYRLVDETGELIALADCVQKFASPVAQTVHWIRIHPRIIFVQ